MLNNFYTNDFDIFTLKRYATITISGLQPAGVKVNTKQINQETKIDSFYYDNREIKIEGKIFHNVDFFLSQIYSIFVPGDTVNVKIIKTDGTTATTEAMVEEIDVERYKLPCTYEIILLSDHYLNGEEVDIENVIGENETFTVDTIVKQGFVLTHTVAAGETSFTFSLNGTDYTVTYDAEVAEGDVLTIDTNEETVFYNENNIFYLFPTVTVDGLPKLQRGTNTLIIPTSTKFNVTKKILGV